MREARWLDRTEGRPGAGDDVGEVGGAEGPCRDLRAERCRWQGLSGRGTEVTGFDGQPVFTSWDEFSTHLTDELTTAQVGFALGVSGRAGAKQGWPDGRCGTAAPEGGK